MKTNKNKTKNKTKTKDKNKKQNKTNKQNKTKQKKKQNKTKQNKTKQNKKKNPHIMARMSNCQRPVQYKRHKNTIRNFKYYTFKKISQIPDLKNEVLLFDIFYKSDEFSLKQTLKTKFYKYTYLQIMTSNTNVYNIEYKFLYSQDPTWWFSLEVHNVFFLAIFPVISLTD